MGLFDGSSWERFFKGKDSEVMYEQRNKFDPGQTRAWKGYGDAFAQKYDGGPTQATPFNMTPQVTDEEKAYFSSLDPEQTAKMWGTAFDPAYDQAVSDSDAGYAGRAGNFLGSARVNANANIRSKQAQDKARFGLDIEKQRRGLMGEEAARAATGENARINELMYRWQAGEAMDDGSYNPMGDIYKNDLAGYLGIDPYNTLSGVSTGDKGVGGIFGGFVGSFLGNKASQKNK